MSQFTRRQHPRSGCTQCQDHSASGHEHIPFKGPDFWSFDGSWSSTGVSYDCRKLHNEDGISLPAVHGMVLQRNTPILQSRHPQTSSDLHPFTIQTVPSYKSVHDRSIGLISDSSVLGSFSYHAPKRSTHAGAIEFRSVPGEHSTTASFEAVKPGGEFVQSQERYLYIHADDYEQWNDWYWSAFEAVQQIACRQIAKEWIKTIHPKKQSTHPYNGRVAGQTNLVSPENTKPPYWPKNVRHKEPDHIDKKERIELLIQLLTNTPYRQSTLGEFMGQDVVAETLLSALDRGRDEQIKAKWDIVCEIVKARSQLEFSLDRGRSASSIIKVPDYRKVRDKKNKKDNDEESHEFKAIQSGRTNFKYKRASLDETGNDEERSSRSALYPIENLSPIQQSQQVYRSSPMTVQNEISMTPSVMNHSIIWSNEKWQTCLEMYCDNLDSQLAAVATDHGFDEVIASNGSIQWNSST